LQNNFISHVTASKRPRYMPKAAAMHY